MGVEVPPWNFVHPISRFVKLRKRCNFYRPQKSIVKGLNFSSHSTNYHIYQLAYPPTSTSPKWQNLQLAHLPKFFCAIENLCPSTAGTPDRKNRRNPIFCDKKWKRYFYLHLRIQWIYFFSVSITIPLIFSGIGYHVFIWIWHRNLSKKARTKFDSFSKMNSAHHFTGIALYVFMLYYTCQELSAHKVNFHIPYKNIA